MGQSKKKEIINEAQLQAECVLGWKNANPRKADRLWATFNEGENVGKKLSMGMSIGCPDLLHYDNHILTGIELKFKGTRHNRMHLIKQAKWLMSIPDKGYFVDSVEMFMSVMEGGVGILPEEVLRRCEKSNKSSILWDFSIAD